MTSKQGQPPQHPPAQPGREGEMRPKPESVKPAYIAGQVLHPNGGTIVKEPRIYSCGLPGSPFGQTLEHPSAVLRTPSMACALRASPRLFKFAPGEFVSSCEGPGHSRRAARIRTLQRLQK